MRRKAVATFTYSYVSMYRSDTFYGYASTTARSGACTTDVNGVITATLSNSGCV